jgi:hypothetical protein
MHLHAMDPIFFANGKPHLNALKKYHPPEKPKGALALHALSLFDGIDNISPIK